MRRRALRPYMREQYRSLCNPSYDITTELFGDNLSGVAKDLGEVNKLTNTITIEKPAPRGRGSNRRGRGGRWGGGRGQFQGAQRGNQNSGNNRGRGSFRRPGFPRGRRGAV